MQTVAARPARPTDEAARLFAGATRAEYFALALSADEIGVLSTHAYSHAAFLGSRLRAVVAKLEDKGLLDHEYGFAPTLSEAGAAVRDLLVVSGHAARYGVRSTAPVADAGPLTSRDRFARATRSSAFQLTLSKDEVELLAAPPPVDVSACDTKHQLAARGLTRKGLLAPRGGDRNLLAVTEVGRKVFNLLRLSRHV